MSDAGLVLAAGASTRMGMPKALLKYPDGTRLAGAQIRLLEKAGCDPVLIVLGSEADRIQRELPNARAVVHPDWQEGRFSSVRAGLRALDAFRGCFILPVDSPGIRLSTLEAMRKTADKDNAQAVRPAFRGKPGYIVWISAATAERLLAMTDEDTPLNQILDPVTRFIPVDDPAIVRNVNTPEEWEKVIREQAD